MARRLGHGWRSFGLMLGRRLATAVRDDHIYLIIMAALVGMASGAAAGLLLWWISYAISAFPSTEQDSSTLVRWMVVVLVPVAGGLLVGGLRWVASRFLTQEPVIGVPLVIQAIAQRGGNVRGRGAVVVGLGTGLTIGSGGSCGHEGPSVAIGAAMGSVLARFFGLRRGRHMAMVGAGCAGGLAAAFNAPLAGVIFTVELVFGGSIGGNVGTMSVFIPLIVAAVAGTLTGHAIQGDHIAFGVVQYAPPALADLVFYVVLAVLAGVIGSGMNRGIIAVRRRFENWDRMPVWLRPAVGALGVGLIAAVASNELLGPGHDTLERAIHGELLWETALLLIGLKFVVTALTVGSGGFGGVFLPSLYIGSCLGVLVGAVAMLVLGPDAHGSGAYALVGMGAIFAGMMHAPLTPIVMLFELTHDYGVILPLMLSCIISMVVSRRLYPLSFYRQVLALRNVVLKHDAEGEVMKRGRVSDLMVPAEAVLTKSAGLDEIRKVTMDADLRATFVVDENSAVIGFINGNQLAKAMLNGTIRDESTAGELMSSGELTLLYATDTLAGAMLAFARSRQEILPVVTAERQLGGVIKRAEILAHYSDKVLGEQEEVIQISAGARSGDEVGLGKGLILERLIVDRTWAGRTLSELDLRGRVGVSVLEWTRGDHTVVVEPKRPLQEGDELAVCGTREQLLRARTLETL